MKHGAEMYSGVARPSRFQNYHRFSLAKLLSCGRLGALTGKARAPHLDLAESRQARSPACLTLNRRCM
eukprot:2323271-Pleurochrysis_carterae.AAC.3